MRFMLIIKSDRTSEAGGLPSLAQIDAMGRFNEAMAKAGVLVDAAGLMPSRHGARVAIGGRPGVTVGPFAEAGTLIAGFWIIEVASLEEAVSWARLCPGPDDEGRQGEIEVRQMVEPDSFEDFSSDSLPEELNTDETPSLSRRH